MIPTDKFSQHNLLVNLMCRYRLHDRQVRVVWQGYNDYGFMNALYRLRKFAALNGAVRSHAVKSCDKGEPLDE